MPKITLAAARVNAGYSQKKAAELLKVSNKTLGSWENGKSMPTADKIDAICQLYGLSYDNINFFVQ
jgi:transcriptional regulator with XRE-family HTH domain